MPVFAFKPLLLKTRPFYFMECNVKAHQEIAYTYTKSGACWFSSFLILEFNKSYSFDNFVIVSRSKSRKKNTQSFNVNLSEIILYYTHQLVVPHRFSCSTKLTAINLNVKLATMFPVEHDCRNSSLAIICFIFLNWFFDHVNWLWSLFIQ